MNLSLAMMLGRPTVSVSEPANIDACAIPMALNAVGRKPEGMGRNFGMLCQIERQPGNSYYQLLKEWPWLLNELACPWCNGGPLFGSQIVFHPFDQHVSKGQITFEQMCDWIKTIEPDDEDLRLEEEAAENEGRLTEESGLPDPANARFS